ncbi:HIT family protein [Salibacterium aidingense]|uniref:HIT family protein n=1 Tax=Salibacterium aidingense TaxID=384933 RepID=UPI00040863C0|nr:HIT family protein [Salibacterium aidingense]
MVASCFYCTKDESLQRLMIQAMPMQISTLYIMKDQNYPGRCVLALNNHKTELYELSERERKQYFDDVADAAERISLSFRPDKINYAIYGDIVSHLHVHLVPKYVDGMNWGEAFDNNPEQKTFLSDGEYEKIRQRLNNVKS